MRFISDEHPDIQVYLAKKLFDEFQKDINQHNQPPYCTVFDHLEDRHKFAWMAVAKMFMPK